MRLKNRCAIAVLIGLLGLGVIPAVAGQGHYVVDHQRSSIEGSIKYTIIGRYTAHFQDFFGAFTFYPDQPEKSSVTLTIKTASIQSTYPSLDRVARSARLLNVRKFPQANFVSTSIRRLEGKGENAYQVTGELTLHGVTREISFPFTVSSPILDHGKRYVEAKGAWVINRKDFSISWHSLLDKGGILVGNHFTVKWKMVAFQ